MILGTLIDLAKAVNLRFGRNLGLWVFAAISLSLLTNCGQIGKPNVEPFYAESTPPKVQEFRWSNGKLPKSFDPARAASAPETDIVRAIFEGLTEIDPKTLKETPAMAEKWTSSDDLRTWTFTLRKDARWSNGKRVTAADFVISWKRLVDLGDKTAKRELFRNIVGMHDGKSGVEVPASESVDFTHSPAVSAPHARVDTPNANSMLKYQGPPVSVLPSNTTAPSLGAEKQTASTKPAAQKLGVEAISDTTLQVKLDLPDKDFPKLVANPIFRPIYGDGAEFETDPLDDDVVTNGAFDVASVGKDGVVLDRSDTYWNKANVSLERVRFVPKDSADGALDAYKKGEIDAVTNVDFEPLALKLLTPYEDFRRTTHSALNFYEFNTTKAPFNDRRVREALALAIDRDKLTNSDLEGTTQPANKFLPLSDQNGETISFDAARAKQLLEKAGFVDGAGFPPIHLVINRNDTQQRVARSVARMWKQNLNLDTVIVVKETSEIEEVRRSGDFDVLRRGVVLSSNDELVNLTVVLGTAKKLVERPATETKPGEETLNPSEKERQILKDEYKKGGPSAKEETPAETAETESSLTEERAMYELRAIPLYFPTSYSLVKPYVLGFEMNGLDAPLLKDVSIDNAWQPKTP
ncbi:MAG: peptide ABC transporter substrate-binding protein [Acidobacteriota bacterium]